MASGEVDANRLYVFGISEGGYGSQRLASFYADYWAAAGPMAGGEPLKNAPVENCANIGFSFLTGADDRGFYRNQLTWYTQVAFDSLQLARPLSADKQPLFRHRIQLLPEMQHYVPYGLTTPWLKQFAREYDVCCIGLPGTIDNDLYGTDSTIGYDTTLNTIVECVDRIRDTAQSHERIFFVEVMGRDAGYLAQNSAIASGAEAAIIPEDTTDVDQLAQFMERGIRKSKKSCIVIVSESPKCGALYYADRVKKEFPGYDVRVSILGHLQRGGRPSAHDRILASRTGVGAIEAIMQGQRNVMVGVRNNEVVYVPLSEAIRSDKPFDRKLIKVLDDLSI